MTPPFHPDELQYKENSDAEKERTFKIFQTLKDKVSKGETLSEHEKEFFCMGIKYQNGENEAKTYSECENVKFKFLYLVYYTDLSGGLKYHKPVNGKIKEVEPGEVQEDLKYLNQKNNEWEPVIAKNNHTEQLLQQLAKETREHIKEFDKLPEYKNIFSKGKKYLFKRKAIILHSKYIYCKALENFERLNPDDKIYEIDGKQIEFNEYSMVHILSRHYAQSAKQYKTNKSFHIKDFDYRTISIDLKNIIKKIDESNLYSGKSIKKIPIQFKGIDYLIWTEQKTKPVIGQGNVSFIRLQSFYPVIDSIEKSKIVQDYTIHKLNDLLSLYVHN
jgi:DNA-binding ferritin-like protein (Dps family)